MVDLGPLEPLGWAATAAMALGVYFCAMLVLQSGFGALLATRDVLAAPDPTVGVRLGRAARALRALGVRYAVLGDFAPRYAAGLDRMLVFAGRPLGGISGRALAAGLTVVGLGVGIALALVPVVLRGADGDLQTGLLQGVALLVAAPVLAHLYGAAKVSAMARAASEEITIEFPFFLDLAVLVVQAGGLPQDTFKQYIEAAPGTALAREFEVTIREVEATSVETALTRLAERIESPPIKLVLGNLAQAQRTSGDLSSFYAEQAIELRSLRSELAESAIEKLKVNLKVPEFMLMFAVALAVIAPALIQMGLF